MRGLLTPLLLFMIFYTSDAFAERLKIHLFSEANGKGLEKDRDILVESLSRLKCDLKWFDPKKDHPDSFADVNIFIQNIEESYLDTAKLNWFIPNPEWYFQDLGLLNSIDLILCRTEEVMRIFDNLEIPTYFLGFTSIDCYRHYIKKDPSKYLHVAGSSPYKGTTTIQKTWSLHPKFPHVTILRRHKNHIKEKNLLWIDYFLSEKELLYLQNKSLVHLCLSATEGFGHYIVEAMSAGAVVITTNAPPMNEFIVNPLCLVPFKSKENKKLAVLYNVDADAVANTIQSVLRLSKEELITIGNSNRERYLKLKSQFMKNLKHLIRETQKQKDAEQDMEVFDDQELSPIFEQDEQNL